jgi:Fe2+ transport system protein B
LLIGTGLDQYEMNAVVATLYFILTNSVMFQVADATLNKELVDLGLPKGRNMLIKKMWRALQRYLRQTGKSSLKLV